MTVQEFQRDLTAFREEQTQVFAVLYPNAASTASAIKDLYGDRVQLSVGADEQSDISQDLSSRLNRFDLMDQRSQGLGIYTAGGTNTTGSQYGIGTQYGTGSQYGTGYQGTGWGYTSPAAPRQGQGSQSSTSENDTLRQLTAQAEAISNALKGQPTSREQQAILDAFRQKQANIYVRVMRRNNLIVVRSSDQAAVKEIAKLIQRLDVPTPTVLLEVKVLSIALGDDFSSVFDYEFSNGNDTSGSFASGDIQPPASDLAHGQAQKFHVHVARRDGRESHDLIFQFVSDSFRLRMQLLESKNRVTELATPLLLTANNEVSRLFVGEEYPHRPASAQVAQNQTGTTVVRQHADQFEPVGTTLLITPNINADRTVTFRILQETSRS